MEWISVDRKLPRVGAKVDVWANGCRHPNYSIVKRSRTDFYFVPNFAGLSCIRDATHWRPEPEPPKERG